MLRDLHLHVQQDREDCGARLWRPRESEPAGRGRGCGFRRHWRARRQRGHHLPSRLPQPLLGQHLLSDRDPPAVVRTRGEDLRKEAERRYARGPSALIVACRVGEERRIGLAEQAAEGSPERLAGSESGHSPEPPELRAPSDKSVVAGLSWPRGVRDRLGVVWRRGQARRREPRQRGRGGGGGHRGGSRLRGGRRGGCRKPTPRRSASRSEEPPNFGSVAGGRQAGASGRAGGREECRGSAGAGEAGQADAGAEGSRGHPLHGEGAAGGGVPPRHGRLRGPADADAAPGRGAEEEMESADASSIPGAAGEAPRHQERGRRAALGR
mmetsp:Transcript_70041/g.177103  ORF Transcript_70041/g.177103 Transcript_70041/m.177103 type:complete len:325 (+) Transcript_70041:507-1481(+)